MSVLRELCVCCANVVRLLGVRYMLCIFFSVCICVLCVRCVSVVCMFGVFYALVKHLCARVVRLLCVCCASCWASVVHLFCNNCSILVGL